MRSYFRKNLANPFEFFTIRSHLHFKPEFTSRGLKFFSKSCLPPLGIELTTLTIIRSKVKCLSRQDTDARAAWQTLNLSLFHTPFDI